MYKQVGEPCSCPGQSLHLSTAEGHPCTWGVSSIRGVYPLHDGSTRAPSCDNQECHRTLPSVPRG